MCSASSSSHFRFSTRLFSTSASFPVCSPARTRLVKTGLKICGYWARDCDRFCPPWMLSRTPEITSRNRAFSLLSRRSISDSTSGTPAPVSCSMWKQKLISSERLIAPKRNRLPPRRVGPPLTRSRPMRFKRSSRATRLIASIWPSMVFPRVSMALYAKSAMFDPWPAPYAGRGLHPVGEVDHAHQFVERGRAVEDPASAVVGQRAKAPREGRLLQFPAGGAVRDQLVELAVHLQDLDDGHAT